MRDGAGLSSGREEFAAVHAIRDTVPTRRHAEMLFDMVVEMLGDGSWVETWNDGAVRTLFRRVPARGPFVIPHPLLSVVRGGREGPSPLPTAIPGIYEAPPTRPGRAPRLRDLGPGRLEVHDGPHRAEVAYGGDGRWFETVRSASPTALCGVLPALEAGGASPVELLADFVASLDVRRHGPGRVFLPVPLPVGVRGAWNCGLLAIREALFAGGDAAKPGVMAADGWTGRALARGATQEAALDAWKSEVAKVRPFPKRPERPVEPLPESTIVQEVTDDGFRIEGTLRGPASDAPWVEPTVGNAPAAVLPIEAPPESPTPIGEWTLLAGGFGSVFPAAIAWEPEGFTMVGDRLLDRLCPGEWEERLAAADRDAPGRLERPAGPTRDLPDNVTRVRTYRFADEETEALLDRPAVSTSWTRGFSARGLDGDCLRGCVVRMRVEGGRDDRG